MKFSSWWNFGLDTLAAVPRLSRIPGLPVHVTIEPTNACQLRCPVCETGAGILRRPKGVMSLDAFKAVMAKLGGQVDTLLLYFMGETFLNPQAYAMIEHAARKGILVSICTNGESINPELLSRSGVDEVSFQIGGMTNETHARYRVGGHLDKVLSNLETLVRIDNDGVQINLGFIVMKHNEHEVDKFRQYSERLGVKGQVISPCVRTLEQGKLFLPANKEYWIYDEGAFDRGILKPKSVPRNRCWWIYYSTVVMLNGDVVPCCRDAQGDFVMGNILQQNFADIWNGEKYRKFRKLVATNQRSVGLCRLCSGYLPPIPLGRYR
jgi:radical SAM protein with 4Fe4S-binding SPASM domain